jgi:hypothetical protein
LSVALRRVVVRLLHDPSLVARVFEGGAVPELSDDELRMLRAVDRRAFGTDPLRPARVLQALLEELPVASAVAAGGRPAARLLSFFQSPEFHAAVMRGDPLWLAYAQWLAPRAAPGLAPPVTEGSTAPIGSERPALPTVGAGPFVLLEAAIARARRWRGPPGPGSLGAVRLADGCWPVLLPDQTVSRWQFVRQRLGADPVGTLARGVDLSGAPRPGVGSECVVVVTGSGGDRLEYGAAGLHPALTLAQRRTDHASLLATLVAQGADDEEAAVVLAQMFDDGWLVAE